MVPGLAAYVSVGQVSARTDHEYSPKLPGISLDTGLPRARPESSQGIKRKPRREQLDTTASETCGAIGAKLRIHEKRAVQLEVLTERGGKVRSPVSDDDRLSPSSSNIAYVVAQLRDLLTAKQSTKVTDENQNDRTFFPELSESLRHALPIEQLDVG
jgi:hypothetical protein